MTFTPVREEAVVPSAPATTSRGVGPILYMRGVRSGRLLLRALLVRPLPEAMPELVTEDDQLPGKTILKRSGYRVQIYDFNLPAASDAAYRLGNERYTVNAEFGNDLRLAFVSCNGQEDGDRRRPLEERNAMWRRLAHEHAKAPFQLLLHGGDQIYTDEIINRQPLAKGWPKASRKALDAADSGAIAEQLRQAIFQRYLEVYSQPEPGWLMARIPSLAMWDDHDICDGWGSLPEDKLDSDVGRALFEVAREHFLLFQLGALPDDLPDFCLDTSGTSLSWHLSLDGLHLFAPDLRSERRPHRVMGETGWATLEAALKSVESERVLLLSSVPALGPRLSWVEALLQLIPTMQKYEDDLRDQWQSRMHREEWKRFLKQLIEVHTRKGSRVTVLSGEIHLATRGTLETPDGPLHQLVASGITHPAPPPLYARSLSLLARLGESPLPRHPIRLHPLPGRSAIYTPERNYLVLERWAGQWRTWWELEESGTTPPLDIG